MKLLIINPTHPATPHISAVRAWRFAEELAKRGHCVVFLCATQEDALSPEKAPNIEHHDWRKPFLLACSSERDGWQLKKDQLPLPARKALTVWRMVSDGGELGSWTWNAIDTMRGLSNHFRPDVVWTTFGKMEAVFAARRLARLMNCPWVLDIKDNWELYVPRGLRRLMVIRTRGWATLTANAAFTQEKARVWHHGEAAVIYSGVDEAFFDASQKPPKDPATFCINLIGSLYFPEQLDAFLEGLQHWAEGLNPVERSQVKLCYLGGDLQLFTNAVARVNCDIAVAALGYRPVAELARHCRNAAVNAYIANPRTFHHKLLELLSCDRPVLAFPAESAESWALARRVAGDLRTPATADEVSAELSRLHQRWSTQNALPVPDTATAHAYSWSSQAAILEVILKQTIDRARPHHAQ